MSGCLCDLPLAGRHFDCRGQWGEPRATWSSHGRCVQMDCGDNAGYRRKTRQGIVEQSGGDNTRYRGKPRRGVVEQGALSGVGAILQRAGHGKSAGRPKPPLACRRWDARFLRYSGRSTAAIANDRCDINECVLSTLNCLSKRGFGRSQLRSNADGREGRLRRLRQPRLSGGSLTPRARIGPAQSLRAPHCSPDGRLGMFRPRK